MIGPAEIREMLTEYEERAGAASAGWPRPAPTWPVLVASDVAEANRTGAVEPTPPSHRVTTD